MYVWTNHYTAVLRMKVLQNVWFSREIWIYVHLYILRIFKLRRGKVWTVTSRWKTTLPANSEGETESETDEWVRPTTTEQKLSYIKRFPVAIRNTEKRTRGCIVRVKDDIYQWKVKLSNSRTMLKSLVAPMSEVWKDDLLFLFMSRFLWPRNF